MSLALSVFAHVAPSATTETLLHEVGAEREFNLKTLMVCNRGAAAATFRVSISVAGAATANKDYLYYDLAIAGNDTFLLDCDIWLYAADDIRVYASTGDLSFTASGQEYTLWRIQ